MEKMFYKALLWIRDQWWIIPDEKCLIEEIDWQAMVLVSIFPFFDTEKNSKHKVKTI